jgi:hypothetical protein
MYTVEFRLKPGQADLQMNRTRLWLKSHCIEPASFGYRESGQVKVVQVEFDNQEDANAFSGIFDGVCLPSK